MTIDTESTIGGAFTYSGQKPLIHEPVSGEVNGRSEALGFLIETLCRHGLVATFFVEALHTRYFGERAMGGHVEKLVRAGQDVQLHLHPNWLSFERGKRKPDKPFTDNCHELSVEHLAGLIAEGADQIADWTGKRAIAMRAGNFSTGLSVFQAIQQAGLRVASNICVAVAPPPERELTLTGGVHEIAGVRELPVTCFADIGPVGRGHLRPMQARALTAREVIVVLEDAHACGNPVVVIVTHPFEFVKKRDFRYAKLRPNHLVQHRFRRICAFLAENTDRFEDLPIATAADTLDPSQPWTELRGSRSRSIVRAAENAVNDHPHFI